MSASTRAGKRCPADHKHDETSTCYVHHRCRCGRCRGARNRYERTRRKYAGCNVWVSAAPTARRLQALATIGWSAKSIAARLPRFSGSSLALIREGDQAEVTTSTAESIAAIYSQLAMTPNVFPGNQQARAWARKHEWLGPFDWADIERGVVDLGRERH